ncbi:RILP-like protein 1 [Denticeps clupeoides]|uniref:RILP-like protein 1 n=1 Tax=Denticeps clupeoides TaxID=299321 RepID=A0AAY4DUX4_9TELE|nr:RILP-like protein 1 [Denticeps clupeoides]
MDVSPSGAFVKIAADLTVVDVYDIAAALGQEFERIIDQHGCDTLARLMPKVVRLLELLEVLVSRGSRGAETEELRLELDRLRVERRDRVEQDRRHQQELESVEDTWRGETQELLSQVSQLQAQNKSLLARLRDASSWPAEEPSEREGSSEKHRQVVTRLKEALEQQRDEIRARNHELELRNEDVEALQLQQHRLMKVNQDLRHRMSVLESQGKALIQQRAELEALVQARQQELQKMSQRQDGEGALRRGLATAKDKAPHSCIGSKNEKDKLPESAAVGACPVQSSLWAECAMDRDFLSRCCGPAESPALLTTPTHNHMHNSKDECIRGMLQEDLLEAEHKKFGEGKAEEERYNEDQKDPNSPCFTLQDLQAVLQERNELKAQLFIMQEELAYYRNEEQEENLVDIVARSLPPPLPQSSEPQESGIKRLLFTAIMPMVAAGLISDDPTLLPIRRLISFV